MVKKKSRYTFLVVILLCLCVLLGVANPGSGTKYKCMVQLINYEGEGAYITVSVLDKAGNYIQSLRVLGDDKEWYPDLVSWWKFQSAQNANIDAITGATIAGGERSLFVLEIDPRYIDADHSLRFETAVEDQNYHEKDLEVALTSENMNGKFEGSGYIRYVRMMPVE